MKQRSKVFGDVKHNPDGYFPINITTIHTRKGAGFWAMSLKKAEALRRNLEAAIRRAKKGES